MCSKPLNLLLFYTGFIPPMMEKKTCQSPKGVRNDVTSQYPTPVPLKPNTNNTPMMPCNPGEFRSIASQLKRNSSIQPENPFRAQTQHASRTSNYAQHYGNFQGAPGRFQGHNLPQNGTGAVHPAMLLNIPQNNHSMQPYMTPFQSPGFQVNQIAQIRMQRNREAYNAFTAYGHPFGVFWSRQN